MTTLGVFIMTRFTRFGRNLPRCYGRNEIMRMRGHFVMMFEQNVTARKMVAKCPNE